MGGGLVSGGVGECDCGEGVQWRLSACEARYDDEKPTERFVVWVCVGGEGCWGGGLMEQAALALMYN